METAREGKLHMSVAPSHWSKASTLWSRGGLTWKELIQQIWRRIDKHELLDRAGLLSFYFLLALFPLLIVLSSLIGFVLTSQTDTYWTLLSYVFRFMPRSAFALFTQMLNGIRAGASGGKLSFGLLASLWTASSGVAAIIEALNVAFAVPSSRSWWHRRLVAMGITLGIGALLITALALLFASSTLGQLITGRLPILNHLASVSDAVRWLVCLALLFCSMLLIYSFGPNIHRKRWEGILPGTCFALIGWGVASVGLRLYLAHFGSLGRSYGSLAGVVALLFWLYVCAGAMLLGGELNAIIWQASENGK